jgi:hypothetical protein
MSSEAPEISMDVTIPASIVTTISSQDYQMLTVPKGIYSVYQFVVSVGPISLESTVAKYWS